jgi:signal transduction histidine kinase
MKMGNRNYPICVFTAFLFMFILIYTSTYYGQSSIKSINIVSDDNYPPYIFRNDKGELQGILVDRWKLWESKTGVHANLLAMDWGRAIKYMNENKADVIETIFYNEERAQIFDFSKPYAKIDVPVFFHKTLGGITDIRTLRGFTIGVKSGDLCIEILKQNGITTLKEYSNYESIIKAAANGDVRVFCIDKPPAIYFLYKNNLENEFNYSFTLYSGEFHNAVKKGNTELLNLIEYGFSKISNDEKEKIEKKWLGTTLGQPAYFRYTAYFVLIVIGVVLFLLLLNLILRRKVKEKTKELISAKEKAENSDKLKSEFLTQISHEIRSPLNVILNFAGLIKSELSDKIDSDQLDYFKFINSAGKRLTRTIDLVINASEMQLGTYEPTFANFGLIEDIIEKIMDDYIPMIKDKGLEFKFTSNISEALIKGDNYSIYQIFVNLIENAIKYTSSGYIGLTIEGSNEKVKVSIEDTGIGIAEDYMERLFEPFMQEERGYSRRFDGNGLGLSLVKKYCYLNGIEIKVESQKGIGSTFTLIFECINTVVMSN